MTCYTMSDNSNIVRRWTISVQNTRIFVKITAKQFCSQKKVKTLKYPILSWVYNLFSSNDIDLSKK